MKTHYYANDNPDSNDWEAYDKFIKDNPDFKEEENEYFQDYFENVEDYLVSKNYKVTKCDSDVIAYQSFLKYADTL